MKNTSSLSTSTICPSGCCGCSVLFVCFFGGFFFFGFVVWGVGYTGGNENLFLEIYFL